MMMRPLLMLALFGLLLLPEGRAQILDLDSIMNGEDYVGYLPENLTWSADSRSILFTWNPGQSPIRDMYIWTQGDSLRALSPVERNQYPEGDVDWTPARDAAVWARQGDIFVWDRQLGKTTQVTSTRETERQPMFGRTQTEILYQSGNNLYLLDRQKGLIRQLSDLRDGKEKKPAPPSAQDEWLIRDQAALFGVLNDRRTRDDLTQARRKSARPDDPAPRWLGDRQVRDLRPDRTHHYAILATSVPARPTGTDIPDYVTGTGYTRELNVRPKVGHLQDRYPLQILDLSRDTLWDIRPDSLPGIRHKPLFLKDYLPDSLSWTADYDRAREVIPHGFIWSDNLRVLIEWKSLDNKDRWITVYDPATGILTPVDHQHDEAWIGGPGISGWTGSPGLMGWLDEGRRLWFMSEVTGYAHLYVHDLESRATTQLTHGPFEVLDVQLSRDRKMFYLRANADGPFEQHFYHLPASGGPLRRITRLPGNHEVSLSPDERRLAIRYSSSNQPWELYVMDNRPGADMARITWSTTAAFNAYPWRIPEIVRVPADDGARVPGRLYRPSDPNGAAVIFVHGAGYLQNVHSWWSSYFREYMFHNLLCDEGFTVLDLDYRASSGYGRDWRTAIYRHMGGRDLEDQVDGARFLVDSVGIDARRIGIYGGSYGGFITIMALFRHPGTFACGAALRSVTDWAHYNHPYTSNILNTPAEDSLAYRQSSPIYFADGLSDPLLMLHGMIDTNVHFQDVVRLSQRLIELGKTGWDLAVFPLEDHGFVEPSSWRNEYHRIHDLFMAHLLYGR